MKKFNGMFAFAVYNKNTCDLILVRDRIGIKPLYCHWSDHRFVFASELKPIMNFPGFKGKIDPMSLNTFLYHGYIAAPLSIFQDVYKLEPGTMIIFKGNTIEKKVYWQASEKFRTRIIQSGNEEKFRIVDPINVTLDPVYPPRTMFLILGLLGGLSCGAGIAILLMMVRPVFLNHQNITETLALPVLGSVGMVLTPSQVVRRRIEASSFIISILLLVACGGVVVYFQDNLANIGHYIFPKGI